MRAATALALSLLAAFAGSHADEGWRDLFNGKNLDGWTPKVKGYPAGVNFGDTFRATGGVIRVAYDGYGDDFQGRFGHLFAKHPYSHYLLRLDYRFTGEQVKGGPGWAWRNSGVMIHGQMPQTMRQDQDFPVSAEVQLLGGGPEGVRHTGNLCTPGTHVVREGKLETQHCMDSTSDTYRGDQWVSLEIEVHGRGDIRHRINGKEVMAYREVQYDESDADARALAGARSRIISGGSISLQAESHPVEFRNIRLKPLPPR